MKTPEENKLWDDILGGDELGSFRDATLGRSLDAMRHRTRRRRQFQAGTVMALFLLFAIRWHFQLRASAPSDIALAPAHVSKVSTVKYLTEKELFALFPNRPIALIGGPGHQQFILLDELGAKPQQ